MPEELLQFLQALWTALQSFAQNAVEEESIQLFQTVVQWAAILLSALAGTYAARKRGMDFFGVLVIAFVTCVGGGTIRDMLLGRLPVFWLESPVYMVTVLVVSMLGMFIERGVEKDEHLAGQIAKPIAKMVRAESPVFLVVDSLALGLWAYLGSNFALAGGVSPILAPVLGVITAIFGGVLRDIFFARVPEQFLPGQLYATAAAVGAIVYVLSYSAGLGGPLGFVACIVVTFAIRIASVKFHISSS